MSAESALPLAGITVIDLGQIYNAPYATLLLALAGADVIKVEPLRGESLRGRSAVPGRGAEVPYQLLNSNKRSTAVNLKDPRGRDLLIELCAGANVLVENFRPGVMDRLGLSYEALSARNPGLIVASSNGYGSDGDYRDLLAVDLTIQAMSGVMSTTGFADNPPVKAGPALADFLGGIHLYGAVVTALVRQAVSGVGARVEVAMLDAVLPAHLSNIGAMFADRPPTVERTGNQHGGLAQCPYNLYATSDGFVAIITFADEHWVNLCRAMDRPELGQAAEYATMASRVERMAEVDALIEAWTRERSTEEAFAALRRAGAPSAPVRTLRDVVADPHLRQRGMVSDTVIEGLGSLPLLHSPLLFLGEQRAELRPSRALGADTRDVLRDRLGLDDAAIDHLAADNVVGVAPR